MLRFDIITIFPEIFDSYLGASLINRAQKKKLIKVKLHDLRKWTLDRHKTVDDRPYGGGIGMVLKVEPIYKAVRDIKKLKRVDKRKRKIILFTPRGKQFDQKTAYFLSKLSHVIMICGRYEGVDERVARHIADMKLSIGNYVLMGGELPSMVVIETVARLIPRVLGKPKLLKERITKEKGFIEYSQYTRPETFSPKKGVNWKVPKVLLSGHHKKIKEWRKKHEKVIKK
ncbi:MAG: tRNA (guanosine(37)-N1)-methyltransferase TrmD [Candidatus Nealsonbacteria bacterium]